YAWAVMGAPTMAGRSRWEHRQIMNLQETAKEKICMARVEELRSEGEQLTAGLQKMRSVPPGIDDETRKTLPHRTSPTQTRPDPFSYRVCGSAFPRDRSH